MPPSLPIYAEAHVVAYASMPSPSSSPTSSPSQSVSVLQYKDNKTLDSTSSIDSNDRGN